MFKRINRRLCLISKRYKFHRICKAIGIKPYKWQKEYALGKILTLPMGGRGCGKTLAVMLKLLMQNNCDSEHLGWILNEDPDFLPNYSSRAKWYKNEYRKLSKICNEAGIPVVMIPKDGYSASFVAVDELHRKEGFCNAKKQT